MVLAASLVVSSVAVFAFMRLLPGDPARVALGLNASDEAVAQMRAEFGLDRSLPAQYLDWVGGILTLQPGREFVSGSLIGPQVVDGLLVTLWLVVLAMIVAVAVAVPLGVWMAIRHRHVDGVIVSALSQLGIAVPAFLAAILLITVFSVNLGWLPSGGWVAPAEDPAQFVQRLILPVISLALVQGSVLARYVRTAVVDVLGADYVRTARAKGLRPGPALVRHGLRNASVPVVTVLGLQLATLLTGAVVIERVFVIPGIGALLLDSVAQRELLTVQAIVMVLVAAVLLINYLVDALYLVLDPRLRTSSA